MSLLRTLPCLFGLALLGLQCASDPPASETAPTFEDGRLAFVSPAGDTLTTITLAIADTDAERQRGLMRQRSLGYDRGMLFIFEEVDSTGMWMKNTPLPLDIVFVDAEGHIINIARRTTPFSEAAITPTAPNKYAVEVRAGFADKFGLTDRTRIRWTRTD
jgi:uncharacterized membrane protein (UPF0127 family)